MDGGNWLSFDSRRWDSSNGSKLVLDGGYV
jgi:hypothetical protein